MSERRFSFQRPVARRAATLPQTAGSPRCLFYFNFNDEKKEKKKRKKERIGELSFYTFLESTKKLLTIRVDIQHREFTDYS